MACQGDTWVEQSQEAAIVEQSASDAGKDPAALTARDDEPDARPPNANRECEPYTDDAREMSQYADDFPEPGPDLAMTWRPDAPGVYVVSLVHTGEGIASFQVLSGTCHGTQVPPIQGLEGEWPGFSFVASPDQQYTFLIEAEVGVETVQLSVELGCEHTDDAHCVREGDEGEPECGLRYSADQNADHMSCEAIEAPGEVDSRCPTTTFREQVVEGCCRPSGECGHLDPELGCHDLARTDWAWSPPLVFHCDERTERAGRQPPAHFECSRGACEDALDCCADPIDGNAACVEGFCVPAL